MFVCSWKFKNEYNVSFIICDIPVNTDNIYPLDFHN